MKKVIHFTCKMIGIVLAVMFIIVLNVMDVVAGLLVCLNKIFRYIYVRVTRLIDIDDDEWTSDLTKMINYLTNRNFKTIIDTLYPNEFES